MRNFRRNIQNIIENSILTIPAYYAMEAIYLMRYVLYGYKPFSPEDVQNMEENVTICIKSFNRQCKTKRLYKSIRKYYPNIRILIADDSKIPLEIPGAEIIYLPFNSGLPQGMIATLNKVETPYHIRLDDDMLFVPQTHFPDLLRLLQEHEEVDMASVTCEKPLQKSADGYLRINMGKPMKIPVGTKIGKNCIVSAKVPNCFVARTESVREVGYDPNIRLMDHQEFFFRAAGKIVAVIDPTSYILHCHNPFDWRYRPYRSDIRGDAIYIWKKHAGENYR